MRMPETREEWRQEALGIPGFETRTHHLTNPGPHDDRHIFIESAKLEEWLANFGAAQKPGSKSLPTLQAKVREVACQLWPNGGLPARVKDRNAQIRAAWPKGENPPDSKTIQRAFKNWTALDN